MPNTTLWCRVGRWLALAVALALGLWTPAAVWFPSLSPHLGLGGALAAKTASAVTLVGLPVLVLVLIWPKWFCHYACPTGFLQDLLSPRRAAAWRRWPPIGKWLLVITLGGAALGYPVFLWLDPLAIFNGFLNAWHKPVTYAAAVLLPAVLVFNLFLPKVWCQRICPLGAFQEMLALLHRHKRTPLPAPHQKRLARRAFIGVCAGAAGAVLIKTAHGRTPLRPPGALPEDEFTGVCVRCGNCGAVCPSHIIKPDLKSVEGFLAPVLKYTEDYCRENCNRCGQVCPSGAIARLPLAEKRARLIGVAVVNLETCAMANGQECTACIRACPFEALAVAEREDGMASYPKLLPSKCNGCGACESVCPVWPKVAIPVVPLKGERI